MATAPNALPRAMLSRFRLVPSSFDRAFSAPRASITATQSFCMPAERAWSRAAAAMVWAWASVRSGMGGVPVERVRSVQYRPKAAVRLQRPG